MADGTEAASQAALDAAAAKKKSVIKWVLIVLAVIVGIWAYTKFIK